MAGIERGKPEKVVYDEGRRKRANVPQDGSLDFEPEKAPASVSVNGC